LIRRRTLVRAGAFCSLIGSSCFATVPYNITDLGTLGGVASYVNAMNGKGQIVGHFVTPDNATHAFLYDGTAMSDLGTLGGTSSVAESLNDAGQIVGYAQTPSGAYHAFLFANGAMTDLGTLGGHESEAHGINAAGQIVGGAAYGLTTNDQHAFLYDHGQMIDLGTLGGTQSSANAINDAGQIVGSSSLRAGVNSHALLYAQGKLTDLGTLGGTSSGAEAINNDGTVVGYAYTAKGATHAVRFADGTKTDLGTFGGSLSAANAINAIGEIVGYAYAMDAKGFDVGPYAFLQRNGSMTPLDDLIAPSSGWILKSAQAINDSGQIAGLGVSPSGQTHAFLLTPNPPHWSAPVGGDFADDASWDTGFAPQALQEAIFDQPGSHSATFNSSSTISRLTISAGEVTLNVGPHVLSVAGTVTVSSALTLASGTLNVGGSLELSDRGLFAQDAGAVSIHDAHGAGSIAIRGGTFTIMPGSASPTSIDTLTIVGSGKFDLTDSSVLLNHPTAAEKASLVAAVAASYDGGRWTGSVTTSVAAQDTPGRTTLAAVDNAVAGLTTLRGQPVSQDAFILTYALYGDANLDGRVDADDYALLDRSFAKSLPDAHWTDGDFNYDGVVDAADYLLIDTTYLLTHPASPDFLSQRQAQFGPAYVQSLLTSIPEPTSFAACGLAAFLVTRRRRARHI
jgi:probable HAF family extracellular repeat protein